MSCELTYKEKVRLARKALREMTPSSTWVRVDSSMSAKWFYVLAYADDDCAACVYPPSGYALAYTWHVWQPHAGATGIAFTSGSEATLEAAQLAAERALRAAGIEVP